MTPSAPPAVAVMLDGLEVDCPDCPTDEDRAEHAQANQAWMAEDSAAYEAFVAGYKPPYGAWEAWQRTDTYHEIQSRQPDEWPDHGCHECDYLGTKLTEDGKALVAFLSRYGFKRGTR